MGTGNLCFHIACFQLNACNIEGLGVKLPDVCPCQPLTSGSAFCAAHMQVALEKGCPTSVKGFLKFCGASKETGSVVYFCFSDVLVSQLLLFGFELSHLCVAHVYHVLPSAAKPVYACVVVKVIVTSCLMF